MKKKMTLAALFVLATTITHADNLVGFGDSLSDTGNLARFTYNSGKIYNEHLANYLGEKYPEPNGGASTLFGALNQNMMPPSLIGPNFAQGGATVNENLGMGQGFFQGGFIKFQTGKQIDRFFSLNKDKKDFNNLKAIYWIGGNDMRLISEIQDNNEARNTINQSTEDIKKQLTSLSDKGIKFIIVPTVPDISYTPKFFKQFAQNYKIDGKKLFTESGWFTSGLEIKDLDALLDEPSKADGSLDDIIKDSIKKLLEKQQMDSSDKNVDKWFAAYKEERGKLSERGRYFNEQVNKHIEEIKENNKDLSILRPDTAMMIKEVVEHSNYYGFTNFTGAASKTFGDAIASPFNFGKGTGRERISAFEPEDGKDGKAGLEKKHLWGKGYHYLFADEFHPSPEGHKIVADYMISLLETKDGKVLDNSILYKDKISKDQGSILTVDNIKQTVRDSKDYEKGYVHFGAIKIKNGGKLNFDGLNLTNDGVAIAATGEGSEANFSNFDIKNRGRISSAIEVSNGAKLSMENGTLASKRGSRISYPVGVRVNGENSSFNFKDSELKMSGSQSVGITVGNGGYANIKNSKISMAGKGNKGVHIWNSKVQMDKSKLDSETGVWIFANSNGDSSNLILENSEITAKDYAIDISENITRNRVFASVDSNNSTINGGIITGENDISNIYLKNSLWNMGKDSSVSNLNLSNSKVYFSNGDKNNFHELVVDGNYAVRNSSLYMKGKIAKTDTLTDILKINGNVKGNTSIDYTNIGNESVATNYGIKIVDLKKEANKNAFVLTRPVYAGNYEYALLPKENKNDKANYFYLTSNIMYKDNQKLIVTDEGTTGTMVLSHSRNHLNGKSFHLLRPSVAFESIAPHANMEANFQNVFHVKDRSNMYLTIENNDKTLREGESSKINMKNNVTKLSYPVAKNYGVFFSASKNSMKLYDNTRNYFNKNSYLGTLDRKDYNIGMYYENSFAKKIYFDSTLQYEMVSNKYDVEGASHKKSGHGFGASTQVSYPVQLSQKLEFNPHYQIDFFEHKIGSDYENAIRNNVGADLGLKGEKYAVSVGVEYQDYLKDIKKVEVNNENFRRDYNHNELVYKIQGEVQVSEPFKLFGNVQFSTTNDKNISYKLGGVYRF